MILWQIFNALYCFVGPGHLWLLYVINPAGGIFSAGYGIGLFGLLLKLSPPSARTMGMAVFVSISSLTRRARADHRRLAAFLRADPRHPGDRGISRGVPAHPGAHDPVLFAAAPAVREANSASVTDVVGAMRNVRTVASLFGLTFLVNQVFYRSGARPSPPPQP